MSKVQLEDVVAGVDLLGNQIRKKWSDPAVTLSLKGGFKVDLVEAIIKSGSTMRAQLQKVGADDDILELVDDMAAQMEKAAAKKWTNFQPPTDTGNPLASRAARTAFKELEEWRGSTFEQRIARIFKYLNAAGHDSYNDWCAAFMSWVLKKVPGQRWTDKDRPSDAGAQDLAKELKADGTGSTTFKPPGLLVEPEVGDIVFWKRRKKATDDFAKTSWGHVGIVVSVQGDMATTVEGNSGRTLGLHQYDRTFAKGNLHRYDGIVRLK